MYMVTQARRSAADGPLPNTIADVARLALRVLGARFDRDRDGLFVFFVCIILFCVAAAVDSFTNLLVAAAPVVMLASFVTISCVTPYATRRGVGQWGGAGGAICEDHFCLGEAYVSFARRSGDFLPKQADKTGLPGL